MSSHALTAVEDDAKGAARQIEVAAALARVLPPRSILTRREDTVPFARLLVLSIVGVTGWAAR